MNSKGSLIGLGVVGLVIGVVMMTKKSEPVNAKSSASSVKPVPESDLKIAGYGNVYQFPEAKFQPRDDSKVVIDLTSHSEPTQLNKGLHRVVRFVNLFHVGGAKPASAKIMVVLHGGATTLCLNDQAYAQKFQGKKNPNLECLQRLRDAGVEFTVCGQSLTHHDAKPSDVVRDVSVAVSAFTALVNLQRDGYAMIPVN